MRMEEQQEATAMEDIITLFVIWSALSIVAPCRLAL